MITTLVKAECFSRCVIGRDNFLDMCNKGELEFDDLEELIARYKASESPKSLRTVIGLTEDEYISYILKGNSYIFGLVTSGSEKDLPIAVI